MIYVKNISEKKTTRKGIVIQNIKKYIEMRTL